MKIRLIGYIKECETDKFSKFETKAIKNDNKVSYYYNNEQFIIDIKSKDQLILNKKNNEIECIFFFEKNKMIPALYTIKNHNLTLRIDIFTKLLSISENTINIEYTVVDSKLNYQYSIEMSE